MHELYFLIRQFRWELVFRFTTAFLATFLGLFAFGMVLADTVPDWMRALSWLTAIADALRALPPWDFILIAFAITLIGGYLQRVTTYIFRRRNMRTLGRVTIKEHRDDAGAKTISARRKHMLGRSKLSSMMFRLGSTVGSVTGVVSALFFFGYYPSAIIIIVAAIACLLYLPIGVRRWEAGFDRNDAEHQALREELINAGTERDEAEIHVNTERLRLKAKIPVLRLIVTAPLLSVVLPATVVAAAIESWLFAVNGSSESLNKLLILLMAMSLRSMLQLTTSVEATTNRIARVTRPDPTDDEEDA